MVSETVWIILWCALATYTTRLSGHLILSYFGKIHYRVEAALEAVPVAVLTALVAPNLINQGWAEAITLVVACFLVMRFSSITTVILCLLVVVGLRVLI